MFEKIADSICDAAKERIRISKGVLVLIAAAAFIIGLASGAVSVRLAMSRKLTVRTSGSDEFDADEYVRNLSFDEE